MKKGTYYYSLRLFNDFILFCDDISKSISYGKEIIETDYYVNFLKSELNYNFNQVKYPKKQINNLGIIINYLKEINDSEKVDEIKALYEELKNQKYQKEKFIEEANKKVYNIKNLNSVITIDTDMIMFDYYAFQSLIGKNEIVESDYYFTSFKKFLIDIPEIFNDKQVLSKALQVIEEQPIKESTNKIRKEVLHYLKNVKKEYIEGFDNAEVFGVYLGILLQNMLNDYKVIDEYKEYICEVLIDKLDLFAQYGIFESESEKNNAYKIISIYKEKLLKSNPNKRKEVFEVINNKISFLNKSEINPVKKKKLDLVLRGTLNYKLDVNKLIKDDLALIEYIMNDREIDIKDNNIYLSVNKFINTMPCIFEDLETKEKIIDLLTTKKCPKSSMSKIKKITKR